MTSSRSTEPAEEEAGDAPDFLARWSRRKAAARQGRPEPDPTVPAEAASGAPAPAVEPEPATPQELELPDVETLDAGSDFRPFLKPEVPADLRREALRKLWRVNPIINSLDGLDDYYVTQDFTDRATVVADLKTVYRVGKGMLETFEKIASEPPAPAIERRAETGPALGQPAEAEAASGPDASPPNLPIV